LGYDGLGVAAPMVEVAISSEGKVTCNPDQVEVSRSSNTGIQWTMATPGYIFTGIDIDADGKQDFGAATFNEDKTVMTVTDTVRDLQVFTYSVCWKNTQTGATGSFDPGIKNKT
jgi:hypothetical protein